MTNTSREEFLAPGNFIIEAMEIVSLTGDVVDVRLMFAELNIYEDMFANTLSGNIVLNDSINLPEKYAFSGYETFYIKIRLPSWPQDSALEHEFWIYKQDATQLIENRRQAYVLHFASPEFIINQLTKVDQSWNNETQDVIVQDVVGTYLRSNKQVFIEPTRYRQYLVVPSWTPFQTINWLTSRAVSGETPAANYLFFETKEGFHYKSIASFEALPTKRHRMIGQPLRYVVQPGGYRDSKNLQELISIENYYYDDTFNIVQNMTTGLYASHLTTYDIIKKKVERYEFKLNENWDKFLHTDPPQLAGGRTLPVTEAETKFSFFNETRQLDLMFPTHYRQFGDGEETDEDRIENHSEEWLPVRISQLRQISSVRLNIVVPGDTDRRVGDMVNVSVPSPKPIGSETNPDEIVDK